MVSAFFVLDCFCPVQDIIPIIQRIMFAIKIFLAFIYFQDLKFCISFITRKKFPPQIN